MNNDSTSVATSAGAAVGVLIFFAIYFGLIILVVAGLWKMFTKAGKPGWAAIIPIYNLVVLIEIAGKPLWWIILLLIPVVNLVMLILIFHGVSNNFGRGVGTTIGLILLPIVFIPILGFGSAQYEGTAPPAI